MPCDADLVAVRVLLPEVARTDRERGHRFRGAREAARPQEVRERVLALGQAAPDIGLDALVLEVHPVPPEAFAQVDHRGRAGGVEQRIDDDGHRRRRFERSSRMTSSKRSHRTWMACGE